MIGDLLYLKEGDGQSVMIDTNIFLLSARFVLIRHHHLLSHSIIHQNKMHGPMDGLICLSTGFDR